MDLNRNIKQSPIIGLAGAGGGTASYILYGAGSSEFEISRSLKFEATRSSYLSRTFPGAGNRTKWTWSAWVKRSGLGTNRQHLFGNTTSGSGPFGSIEFDSDKLSYYDNGIGDSGTTRVFLTTRVFRDPSAWYHIVVALDTSQGTDATRIKVYVNGVQETNFDAISVQAGGSGYLNDGAQHNIGSWTPANGSLKLDAYLADIHFINGQALTPTDFGEFDDNNVWQPKLFTGGSYGTNGFHLTFSDTSSVSALGTDTSGQGNNWTPNNFTVVSNNYPSYVYAGSATYNGSATSKDFYTGTGYDLFDGTIDSQVGGQNLVGSWLYFRPASAITGVTSLELYGSYNSNIYVNGGDYAFSPSFGSSGAWVTVTSPPSSITEIAVKGAVSSSAAARLRAIKINGVILTDYGLQGIGPGTDTPTNNGIDTGSGGEVKGNYCTLNPLEVASGYNLSDGNLSFTRTSEVWKAVKGTMGVSSGKWYYETTITNKYNADLMFGICSTDVNVYTSATIQDDATERNKGMFIFCDNGKTQLDNNARENYSSSLSSGDTIGIAFDLDAGTAQFYKNGSGLGSVNISTSNIMNGTAVPFIVTYYDDTTYAVNFGQHPWYDSSSVPSGYKALCTQNLSTPTVPDGRKYFDAITWKGTGVGGDQTISGLNLETEADLVWSKAMDTGYHHNLWDNVRGFGARNAYNTDQAFTDGYTYSGRIKSTTNTSITWENDGGTGWYDVNNEDYVAWVWDAGSSTTSYSVGQLNNDQYDTSQNFSGNTSNPTGAYGNASNAFDGSLSTHASPSYGNEMTYTNPSAGSYTIDTLEIYARIYSTAGTGELNGNDIMPQLATGTRKWWTINGFKGQTLNTFKWGPNSGNLEFQLGAIRINGKILVDTGTSVTNIPELATEVRANPAAGFSIAKWSGASSTAAIAHGLSKPPEIQIIKDSNNNYAGVFATTLLSNTTDYMYLNSYTSTSANFGVRAPDYTSFVVGQSANSNYFTYSWHSVEGYSKMGTYVANGSGSGDGQFIHLGFRPKFVFLKNTQNGNSFCISDTARAPFNVVDNFLFPDDPMAEATYAIYGHDILSNGIKIRGSYDGINRSGDTIVFMAFAEHPFRSSRAR